ncbi:unnamed protein product [Anisakis simplex]|uniref:Uncharacterized protein n=1 Tax=Anisakis simplex TaxID=6269 RepID=A0A0M3KBR0_ANISI|nr:unnamed protein product [Anisakis simplex]
MKRSDVEGSATSSTTLYDEIFNEYGSAATSGSESGATSHCFRRHRVGTDGMLKHCSAAFGTNTGSVLGYLLSSCGVNNADHF